MKKRNRRSCLFSTLYVCRLHAAGHTSEIAAFWRDRGGEEVAPYDPDIQARLPSAIHGEGSSYMSNPEEVYRPVHPQWLVLEPHRVWGTRHGPEEAERALTDDHPYPSALRERTRHVDFRWLDLKTGETQTVDVDGILARIRAEPRLHIFLNYLRRDAEGSVSGIEVKSPTDSDMAQLESATAGVITGSWAMPALSGRPYAGIEDAAKLLAQHAANPPADIDPADCLWEAHVGLGYEVDPETGKGIQPHFAVVAVARWDSSQQRHEVELYTPSERYCVVDGKLPSGSEHPRSQARDSGSLDDIALNENPNATLYDLRTGQFVCKAARVPPVREHDSADRVRTPSERPPGGRW